jgi:hypothetical protein
MKKPNIRRIFAVNSANICRMKQTKDGGRNANYELTDFGPV